MKENLCAFCGHDIEWHDEPDGACFTNADDSEVGEPACDCEMFVPGGRALDGEADRG